MQSTSYLTVFTLTDNLLRSHTSLLVIPNFSLKDSLDQTPLAVALWAGLHQIARRLMLGGASVNDTNSEGLTLLHQAVLRKDTPSCIFLMDNQAELNKRCVCVRLKPVI